MHPASASALLLGNLAQTVVLALPFVLVGICWLRARQATLPALAAALASTSFVFTLAHLVALIVFARAGGDRFYVRDLWLYAWSGTSTLLRCMQILAVVVVAVWVAPLWRQVARGEHRLSRALRATAAGVVLVVAPRALEPWDLRLWWEEERLRGDVAWRDLQSVRAPPRRLNGAPSDAPARFSIGVASDAGLERTWACGVDSSRHVVCWDPERLQPTLHGVAPAVAAVDVGVGTNRVCAVDTSETPRCWDPEGHELLSPAAAPIIAITADGSEVCSRTADGHAFCWDYGGYRHGYEGAWTLSEANVVALVAGFRGVCTATPSGEISCRRLVSDRSRSPPLLGPVNLVASAVDGAFVVAASWDRVCAGRKDGVQCLTTNGTHAEASWHPVTDVVQIAVADDHVCARFRSGHLDCWGQDEWGQCDEKGVDDATWVAVADAVTCVARKRGIECQGRGMRP
jgi:hypothetical protein